MDTMQMIKERHSVRSYLDKKIEAEKISRICGEIDRLNEISGLHIQFLPDADGVFSTLISRFIGWKYVPSCIAFVGKDTPNLEEKCGYYGEQLILFLQSIGLNTCWVGIFKSSAVKAEIADGERLVLTAAVGYGADQGKARKSKSVEDVTDVKDMPDWFRAGIESALLAPTAINQQKFRFTINGDAPKVEVSAKGPFVKVDLGIVKYHFEAGSGRKL